jgi:hypothetical protein
VEVHFFAGASIRAARMTQLARQLAVEASHNISVLLAGTVSFRTSLHQDVNIGIGIKPIAGFTENQ